MAHHLLPDIGRDWLAGVTNVLLIRDPREVVASYVKSREQVTASDPRAAAAGQPVRRPVRIGNDPARHRRRRLPRASRNDSCAGCATLVDVEFQERMLHWPAGPRDTDGVWAPYWYATVQASTGFAPYRRRDVSLTGEPANVADAVLAAV